MEDVSTEPLRVTESTEGAGATYSSSDQPTNQPTDQPRSASGCKGTEYVSCRVTIDHDRLQAVLAVFDGICFCLWPHTGANQDNQHYHVLLLIPSADDSRKFVEKIRKRIKDKLGLSGPGKVMVKLMTNDITEAITYCSKERTSPIYQDHEFWEYIISKSDPWVDRVQQPIQKYAKGQPQRKPLNEDHYFQITYQNMEKVTYRYHRQHGTQPNLSATLEHMHKNGWRLNVAVIRGGIPSTYFDQFEAMCKNDTIWKKSRFDFMRVVPNYNKG